MNTAKYDRFEQSFTSSNHYANPPQQAALQITFTSPSGQSHIINGFWDGGSVWRVRFSPDELGSWGYSTSCSDTTNTGLHQQSGTFTCEENYGTSRFDQHGSLKLSDNRRYLVHADGTPFFFLSDTVWNGPLRSTDEEWEHYLRERVRQNFTAVQWVATHWLAADCDLEGQKAFDGNDTININPAFFQRLDRKIDAINRAGLLSVPVMLWAAIWSSRPDINAMNPGTTLPESQAILLARYMLARWGAHHVLWFLPGDGSYVGEKAERWKNIGRAVFGDAPHAPVSLHPNGMSWNMNEFQHEMWLDIIGYQSGHGDSDDTLRWIVYGPPATDWTREPARPVINLEPPYENHIAYQSRGRLDAAHVRKAMYWSLLVAPTAGVSYGGHGVWGWDDGTTDPMNHAGTGIPLAWHKALLMPAGEQMAHLYNFFSGIAWWTLRPAPTLLVNQPGEADVKRFVTASQSESGDLAVIYIPGDREITLKLDRLKNSIAGQWFNPRTGQRTPASHSNGTFTTPDEGDWLLQLS
jgi:hypothetical protein